MSSSPSAALGKLLPREGVLSPEEQTAWAVDGFTPEAVAVPGSLEEAATVVRLARERGWALVPAGRGPRVRTVVPPRRPFVIVSTGRLREVVHYEPADLTLRVGAGATLSELRQRTGPNRQWPVLDPPGAPHRTVGGALAGGEPGPLHRAFGGPRDQVLGLVLLTGDGVPLRLGGDVVKNVAGFDLTRLAVGSRGSLGLIVEASLRVHPLPEADRTVILPVDAVDQGLNALHAAAALPFPLSAAEAFLRSPANGAGEKGGTAGLVAVRLLGSERAVGSLEEEVTRELESWGSPRRLEGEDGDRLFARSLRGEEESPFRVLLSAPLGKVPELLAIFEELSREVEGRGWIHVHGGMGRVRAGFEASEEDGRGLPTVEGCLRFARRVRGLGGGVRPTAGPLTLRDALSQGAGSLVVRELVSGLRSVFDPDQVFPGLGQ